MASLGLRVNRAIPGNDSEEYCATLFGMRRNPKNKNRPDLMSFPNTYLPNFSIEVKSSLKSRGSLVVGQLSYGLTKDREYLEYLDKLIDNSQNPDLFPNIDENTGEINLPETAFYYDVIHRNCDTNGKNYQTPYSAIKFTYGDQFLVPHEFVFNLFAITYARKTINKTIQIKRRKSELKKLIANAIVNNLPLHNLLTRLTGKRNGWQDLEGRLIKGIVTEDSTLFSKTDKSNVKLLNDHYERFADLKKTVLNGPNNSQIYCLYEPEHVNLFECQFQQEIQKNIQYVEEIDERRKELLPIISKLQPITQEMSNGVKRKITSFANGKLPKEYHKKLGITIDQMKELDKLCMWSL